MGYLHLEVDNSLIDNKSRRVTRIREDGVAKPIEIFHEFDRIIPWTGDTLLDGHVFIILLYAASRGKALRVHGAVSRYAMRNIEELQLAWQRWKPALYKKIEIIPDRILDAQRKFDDEKAISAFSGGVDAMFTALRHAKSLPRNVSYPLKSTLMVHGFDIDVYNKDGFEQLAKRVKPLLDDLNLELRVIRTNSRELKLQDWQDSFALELAGCLHMCSDEFQFGLIGSSEPYDALVLPWGSNPVTDNLISGNLFSIIHDGAGFSRTDKVAEIRRFPLACQTLKVCWAGMDQSGNCGKCEKCVRTQMNFLAAGAVSMPPCFPGELDIKLIDGIQIENTAQLAEMTSIVEYAASHKVRGPWLDRLNQKIATWKPADAAALARRKNGGLLKRGAAKIIIALGLGDPAKKIWRKARRAVLKALGN